MLTDPRLTVLVVRFLIRGDECSTDVAKLVGLEGEGGHDLIGNVEERVSHAAKFVMTRKFFTRHTGYISEALSAWTRRFGAGRARPGRDDARTPSGPTGNASSFGRVKGEVPRGSSD